MKTTDHFKRTIQAYLEQRAAEDKLFAVAYRKEGKNIDDCVTYILNEVQRSGCNGFTDGEVYSMAVHYYDEDDIEVGKPPLLPSDGKPHGGTYGGGKGGSTKKSSRAIPASRTPQDAGTQQEADRQTRNQCPTLII